MGCEVAGGVAMMRGGNNEEAPGLYDSGLPKNRSDLLSQLVGQYHQRD